MGAIEANFKLFHDMRNKKGFIPLKKCTYVICYLAIGNVPNGYDEYLAMLDMASPECLEYFCNAIIKLYGTYFLRGPTSHDIARL